ncbi:MarR family transcriptional regulator [Galbitalea sp. SE-J8]|uniref:MarR family transcriptional regulator n=1 Tax=Galbitalea sp. SE-J8 TaxID=3054952 RepID=UPI00259D242B|nr:MarR family transcriptional regulator [Galbitalea sp. SE-J8]MDM4763590.1 MarR family transcriptional regulator [Galbitalea sp. SE-J8]
MAIVRTSTEMSTLARSIIDVADAVAALRGRVGSSYNVSDNELRAAVRVATGLAYTPKALAALLELSTAAVTVIVEHLVDRGIATRRPNPHDRRSTIIELTDLGHEMVETELRALDATLDAMADIDPQAAAQAAALLAAISARLRAGD